MAVEKRNYSPLVSIVMCVYNAEKFLENALGSVKDQDQKRIGEYYYV